MFWRGRSTTVEIVYLLHNFPWRLRLPPNCSAAPWRGQKQNTLLRNGASAPGVAGSPNSTSTGRLSPTLRCNMGVPAYTPDIAGSGVIEDQVDRGTVQQLNSGFFGRKNYFIPRNCCGVMFSADYAGYVGYKRCNPCVYKGCALKICNQNPFLVLVTAGYSG